MDNTYNSIKPFMVLMKFFGIYRLQIEFFPKKWKKLNSLFANLPALINLLIIIFFILFNLSSFMPNNIWNFCTFVGIFSVLIMVCYQQLKWKEIERFVDDLRRMDQKVEKSLKYFLF